MESQLYPACPHRTRRYAYNRIESDHGMSNVGYGPCRAEDDDDACCGDCGMEAVQMIRKGQVLGITKKNLPWAGLGLPISARSQVAR